MLRHVAPFGLALACVAIFFSSGWADEPGAKPPVEMAVFVSGQDGYDTYRIPSVIVSPKGTVLAFCEGRKSSQSDTGNIDMLLKRSTDGGSTFSAAQVVWDDGPNTCGNPCPVVDRATGAVWLLLTHNLGADQESQIINGTSRSTRTVWVAKSTDDGQTWSKPIEITSTTKQPDWNWYATGPGSGIQLRDGRLLIPCDHGRGGMQESHVIYSDDHGNTWRLGGTATPSVDECEVVELADGHLMLNMRNYDRSVQARAIATSDDRGMTWSKVTHDPTLVEPTCQASFRRYSLAEGGVRNRLLFSNPAKADSRSNMTVRLSYDEAHSWPVAKTLWAGPAAYSCLAALPDGQILCLYERGEKHPYETITLARFGLDWLTDGKDR
ncbi:MAG: sialidase family protein [Planctomycetia bacterium]|nr:sialidase family protein [Planctomycetia bacterium]